MIKIIPKFKIGDIVRFKSLAYTYQTYDKAIDFFGITKNVEESNNMNNFWCKRLIPPKHIFEENWCVVNMALHSNNPSNILYHVKNCRGDSMISSADSLIPHNNLNLPFLRKLKEKNKNFKLDIIPID